MDYTILLEIGLCLATVLVAMVGLLLRTAMCGEDTDRTQAVVSFTLQALADGVVTKDEFDTIIRLLTEVGNEEQAIREQNNSKHRGLRPRVLGKRKLAIGRILPFFKK